MGVLFCCPRCDHPLNVKSHLAGKAGFCPNCQSRLVVPESSQMDMSRFEKLISQFEPGVVAQKKILSQLISDQSVKQSNEAAAGRRATDATRSDARQDDVETASVPRAEPVDEEPIDEEPIEFGDQSERRAFEAATKSSTVTPENQADFIATRPGMKPEQDSIGAAAHSQWYVRPPSGGQFGPAGGELMAKWIDEGRVTGDSFVWREGWADWRMAADVFDDLAGSVSVSGGGVQSKIEVPGSLRARTADLKSRRRRTIFGVIGLLFGTAVVLALIMILFIVIQKQKQDSSSQDESATNWILMLQDLPC